MDAFLIDASLSLMDCASASLALDLASLSLASLSLASLSLASLSLSLAFWACDSIRLFWIRSPITYSVFSSSSSSSSSSEEDSTSGFTTCFVCLTCVVLVLVLVFCSDANRWLSSSSTSLSSFLGRPRAPAVFFLVAPVPTRCRLSLSRSLTKCRSSRVSFLDKATSRHRSSVIFSLSITEISEQEMSPLLATNSNGKVTLTRSEILPYSGVSLFLCVWVIHALQKSSPSSPERFLWHCVCRELFTTIFWHKDSSTMPLNGNGNFPLKLSSPCALFMLAFVFFTTFDDDTDDTFVVFSMLTCHLSWVSCHSSSKSKLWRPHTISSACFTWSPTTSVIFSDKMSGRLSRMHDDIFDDIDIDIDITC